MTAIFPLAARAGEAPPISEQYWAGFEPPPGYRAEIIRGELVLSPSPQAAHGAIQTDLLLALQPYLPDGYVSLIGIEWTLAKGGLVAAAPQPDLMVVARGAYPVVDPPLLAVEVLSPSDYDRLQFRDMTRIEGKRMDYATNGLQHYLEVRPSPAGVELVVFDLQKRNYWPRVASSQSGRVLRMDQPFPYELDPGQLLG